MGPTLSFIFKLNLRTGKTKSKESTCNVSMIYIWEVGGWHGVAQQKAHITL